MIHNPRDPNLRYKAGRIFLDSRQDAEGLRWLSSALQEDPNHRPTHQLLADYYRKNGKTELAEEHQRVLLRLGPAKTQGNTAKTPSSKP
jgi:Tfp pilus assembly protein PilF